MSEGRSPIRPARKQPYKPLPGAGPSEIRLSAQETIDEIRRSRVVGSVTIKTEDEKPKIKSEKDSISSNTRSHKQPNAGGHCPKHCPKAKKTKTDNADPDDTLPDLPVTHPIETRDNTRDTIKPAKQSETSLRSVVTVTETVTTMASKMADTTDANEPECEQNVATRSVVTERTSDTTGTVIEIVPMTDPTLEV